MTDKKLVHVGVKGMRWGVRKKRSSSSSTGGKGKSSGDAKTKPTPKTLSDSKKIKKLKQKRLKDLSDSEIAAINKRLQLEKQYKELTKQKVSRGKKFVHQTSSKLLDKTVNIALDKTAQAIVETAIERASKNRP